jgi:glycosyltransferase involved in cell wall biosynthesis
MTTDSPAASVIIPAYLTAPYIAQALDSVVAQSFRDFEVIVVNDGSPDTPELERVLEPYMAGITYIKQTNQGPAHARNTGIASARAPLIALLDSDDFWAPDYLATQIGILRADPNADAVYSNAALFGVPATEGKTYMEDVLPSDGEVSFVSLVSGKCNVIGAATMLRRTAIERAGLYDPKVRLGEDLDLWLRFVKSGGRIVYHRQPLYHARYRNDSLSRQSIAMCESVLAIFDQIQKRFQLTGEERAALAQAQRRITAELELDRGKQAFFNGDVPSAIRDIGSANEYYRLLKLRLVLMLMKTAPGLIRLMDRMRVPR